MRGPVAGAELIVPFALFAGIIFAGVLSHRLFQRTGIPDVIPLLGLGVLLGPVTGLVTPQEVGFLAPFIGAFALLIILLEGGLELNFHHVVAKARATTLLTFVSLAITTLVAAGIAWGFGLPFWPHGILLGLILAPLSASVLVPMLGALRMKAETRAILSLEATLGEAIAIVVLFAAAEAALHGGLDVTSTARELSSTFGIGAGVALAIGLVWLELLRYLGRTPYSYMVTLAAAVGVFALIQFLGGNGYVGVLVFGLVLSNAREITAHLPPALRATVNVGDTVRWMNTEVTFFVRTFFFVYLGMLLSPAAFAPSMLVLAAVLLGGIVVARVLSVALLVKLRPAEKADADLLAVLVPRGLATAVLAAVPLTLGMQGANLFVDVASVLIVLTNIAMTAGVVALKRTSTKLPEPAETAPNSGAVAGDG
jgi:potassium/hydrogen antiporter